ncbi:MAG: hypothetical protein IPP48_04565 [Chitinophagaceae bacterium]|nr:hypothetical protein [Chitinophagaceae bacterium]
MQSTFSQKITLSDIDKDDRSDINFEIIGKMNSNVLIYKNMRWKHRITVLDNEMKELENIKLDFLPEKTFNVDFVSYPDYFFMIYQYQKKNILHCMSVKMDALGKKLAEPVEIDTTQISFFADNKIYTSISSENKEKIMVFKIHKKNDTYTLATKLYDKQFSLLSQHRQALNFDERRDAYDNFSVDNEGNFIFTKETRDGNRSTSNQLSLILLSAVTDSFTHVKIPLDKNFVDDVNIKIDNLNGRYIINSFYYKKNRGNVDGLFTGIWDKINNKP